MKSEKHPELREDDFVNGRLKKAIESPNFVYQDLAEPKNRQVLYLEEFRLNDRYKYSKVILDERTEYLFVITAYRPDYVKERGKTKLLYGKDNGNQ